MKLFKKKGYEDTTVRVVTDDSKNTLGVIGTVKDLVQIGLFDYCTADGNKWASLPTNGNESDVKFTDTREDAIKALKI